MLRFFRQIRKNLMEQNKVRTYILYAIGEIALVMIGILLALQVNNWNEGRKINTEEQRILISLKLDIDQAIVDLNRIVEQSGTVIKSLQILLTDGPEKEQFLNDPNIDSLMAGPLWNAAVGIPIIQTYSDLKNTGEVSLIQSRLIRESLVEIENGFIDLKQQQDDLLTVQQMRVDEIALNYVDFATVMQRSRMPNITPGIKNNYRKLLDNRLVKNTFVAKLSLLNTAQNYQIEMMEASRELSSLIETEIQD